MPRTSFYETTSAESDRALQTYRSQTENWLRQKRATGEIPDLSGRMATAKQNTLNWGGREIESYSLFRQWVYTCFPAGTEIWTPTGMVPIEDVEIGDRVFTHTGRIATVNNTGARPSPDQLVTIRTKAAGRIACTEEHPFLVRTVDGTDWKRADQLVVGDILLRPTIQPGEPVTETRIDITNDRIHDTDDRARYGQSIPLTSSAGYLLGIFLAEGHVRTGAGGSGRKFPKTVAFSLAARYPELHDNVECAMAEVFGLACTTRVQSQGCVTLLFNGRIAAEWFLQCGHLAPNKRLPEFAFNAPTEFKRALLDGYLDGGDGCHHRRTVSFSTTSPSLMMGIVILAQQFGALFTNTRYEGGGYAQFRGYESLRLPGWHPVVCGGNYSRLCEALGWKENDRRGTTHRSEWRIGRSAASVAADGYGEFKIIEVGRSEATSEHVYNLDVDEDHSYVAHGFAVHNCVNYMAKRVAGQPWSAGEVKNAEPKKKPEKTYGLSVRQPWLKQTVPTNMLRRSAPGQDLDVFQTHAILDTIDRPNPLQRRSEFMYMSVVSLLLTGVSYWVGGKVKGKRGPNDKQAEGDKIELWAIPSWLVTPLHKEGLFSHYKVRMGVSDIGGEEIPAANVARTYLPDPSDLTAVYSPLNACIRAIKTDEHIQGSQEGLFARGLMPHHAIVIGKTKEGDPPPILQGASRRQIERTIMDLYWRPINDGFPAIFDGLISDIKRLDPMPREMDWKVSGEIVRDRILRTYGINLLLLGDTQGGNRAQAVMAEENAASNVFNPLADTFTETACEWLAPMFEPEQRSSRIWVWINPFVAHDEEMVQRQWSEARKNGDVDRNEYRAERLGLPPLEDEVQKSSLVETVGGVQGAIAVAQAVGQSILEPEQAQVIFQQFFGLDAKVAKQLAGEKKPVPPQMPGAPGPAPFGAPAGVPAQAPETEAGDAAPAAGKSALGTKYSEDQPRDEAGRFGEGGAEVATSSDDDEGSDDESGEEEFTGTPNSLLEDVARPKLTEDEIREVKEYLAEGTPYYEVNENLRSGGRMFDKTLQTAINKAGVFSSPVKCYRGIEVENIDSFAEEIGDVNGEYTDRGFVSASTKKSFAGNVQMTIHVRHGLDASYYGDNQDEVLLPAGSTFKVLSKSLNRGRLAVELEQVLDDDKSAKMHGIKSIPSKYDHLNFSVTDAMVTAAKQGLAWREEFNRGGTQVGVARANQIINDKTLTPDTWRRVKAYFDRHEVDKQGEGWNQGEPGYPSGGKVAWYLWGSDAGWSRAKKIVAQMNAADEEETKQFKHGSHDQSTHGHGGGGAVEEKPTGSGRKVKEQTELPKTKSEIAKSSAVRVDKEIQRYAEEHNESAVAKKLGGKALPDNEAADVVVEAGEPPKIHGLELKTMVVSGNRKVTMKGDAQARKRTWERKNKATMHTVVVDDTRVFNANGPGKHDESQRRIFYRRGFGSYRVDGMHEVKGGMKELKELLSMDKRKLPKGAKAADEGGAS